MGRLVPRIHQTAIFARFAGVIKQILYPLGIPQVWNHILIAVTNCGFGPLSLLCDPQEFTVQSINTLEPSAMGLPAGLEIVGGVDQRVEDAGPNPQPIRPQQTIGEAVERSAMASETKLLSIDVSLRSCHFRVEVANNDHLPHSP